MSSTPSLELAVQTSRLGKPFGSRAALDGVDLEVPRGVAFGFLGANGAGKTTLHAAATQVCGGGRSMRRSPPQGSCHRGRRI
jgi:ABC-type branched-subunit amino acid transport system ATPase component